MTDDLGPREEAWRKAQQRVSLYLRLMNLPPLESLEVALQTLKRARQDPDEALPLSKSMRVLRQVLNEREDGPRKAPGAGDLLELMRNPSPAALGPGSCRGMQSCPLVNRGFMLPEEFH